MSWKRDIPFGYKMEMSKIVPDKTEADIVKQIFSMYQNGDSLKRISERMEASGARYHTSTEVWNKNMVKRILDNTRYMGKIYVWRCLNRMENGKRICKNSPTFKEEVLHTAIVAAMNEMFSQQAARDVLRESVATALASTQPEMSLPAVKSKLAALEARYKELLNLVMADSAKYEDFEDEFRITNEKMASLKSLQTKLELEQPSTTDLDRRMEQISSAIDQMDASITDYDDIRTRQLISTIKVVDKETLLFRFKDGTEITQSIEK